MSKHKALELANRCQSSAELWESEVATRIQAAQLRAEVQRLKFELQNSREAWVALSEHAKNLQAALAAQQAEREPLTDEQIEVLRKQDDCGEDAPEFARIIRIAERDLADRWGVKLGGIGHHVPGQGSKT